MNNSQFTTKEVLSIIKPAMVLNNEKKHSVVVESQNPTNQSLVEYSHSDPIEVTSVGEDKGMLLIEFNQFFPDGDIPAWSEFEHYTMVITIPEVKRLLEGVKILG